MPSRSFFFLRIEQNKFTYTRVQVKRRLSITISRCFRGYTLIYIIARWKLGLQTNPWSENKHVMHYIIKLLLFLWKDIHLQLQCPNTRPLHETKFLIKSILYMPLTLSQKGNTNTTINQINILICIFNHFQPSPFLKIQIRSMSTLLLTYPTSSSPPPQKISIIKKTNHHHYYNPLYRGLQITNLISIHETFLRLK